MDFSMICCYVIGAIFAFFGILTLIKTLHDARVCTQATIARVVDYETRQDSGGADDDIRTHYYPVYSFSAEGHEVHKAGNVGYSSRVFSIGAEMTVFYEPGNPENFIVPTKSKTSYIVSAVATILGIGLIVFTVLRQMGIIQG